MLNGYALKRTSSGHHESQSHLGHGEQICHLEARLRLGQQALDRKVQILWTLVYGGANVSVLLQDRVQDDQELSEQVEAALGIRDAGVKDHENEAPEALLFLVKVLYVRLVHFALEIAEEVAPPGLDWRVVLDNSL